MQRVRSWKLLPKCTKKACSKPSSWRLFSWKVQKRKVLLGENLYPPTRETMARFFLSCRDRWTLWRKMARSSCRLFYYICFYHALSFSGELLYIVRWHIYLEIFRANAINKLNFLRAKISVLSRTYASSLSSSKFTHNYCSYGKNNKSLDFDMYGKKPLLLKYFKI